MPLFYRLLRNAVPSLVLTAVLAGGVPSAFAQNSQPVTASSDGAAPQSAQDQQTALKNEEKANKQRAKADREQRKALKAQQKANKVAAKAGTPKS